MDSGRLPLKFFDPLPGLEYEYMEDRGNTAIPDVLNQYDAVVVFAHHFRARVSTV